MVAVAEPLSPELVLVAEDLRAAAIAALPEPARDSMSLGPRHDAPVAESSHGASLVTDALRYAAWHALLGAFLGAGLIAAVVLGLFLISLFA